MPLKNILSKAIVCDEGSNLVRLFAQLHLTDTDDNQELEAQSLEDDLVDSEDERDEDRGLEESEELTYEHLETRMGINLAPGIEIRSFLLLLQYEYSISKNLNTLIFSKPMSTAKLIC